MADSAAIGANFSQYTGDPSLGGGSLGAVRIDTRPLEDLARYVMLYNREEYIQRQKNADEKILELAKLATIHVNDLRGKDRDEIMKQLNDTITYAQDYARQVPHSPKEKIQQNLEWQKKTIDLFNNYTSGKARSVKYTKELDAIEADTKISEATKAEKRKQLEEMFGKTKISEQFSGVPEYNLISVSLPTPLTTETDIIQEGANANVEAKLTSFNYKANAQLAFNILSGLGKLYPSERTAEGQTAEAKQQRTIEGEAKAWRDSTKTLNDILQMKDAKGNFIYYTTDDKGKMVFDAVAFEDDISQSPTLLGAYTALKNMDADARAKYNQFIQGRFSDKGFDFKLPPNATLNDFKAGFVDFTKPLSAEQVVTAGIFSRFVGDKMDKQVTPTDNLLQSKQLSLGWFNATKGDEDDKLSAKSVLGEFIDNINNATDKTVENYLMTGKRKTIKEIADPNLLKEFSTIDKDGKTTDAPDVLQYDKESNQFSLVWYEKAATKSGKRIIDKVVPMNPTQLLGQITRRKFPNKDIGGINTVIDEIYSNNGRSVATLVDNFNGVNTNKGETDVEGATTTPTNKSKKEYRLNGKTFSLEKVQKAAQQSRMSVDEYVKKFGLQ